MYTISELKNKRNWTEKTIEKYLGEPDKTKQNPMYRNAYPMKLYDKERVHKIEETDEFKKWMEKHLVSKEKRSKRMTEVNENKRKELLEYIDNLEIKIKKIPRKKLTQNAVDHYNNLWLSRGEDKFACIDDDKKFLKRITKNMLRHDYSIYEDELYKLFGKVGKDIGYEVLKEKVNREINKVYPYLK